MDIDYKNWILSLEDRDVFITQEIERLQLLITQIKSYNKLSNYQIKQIALITEKLKNITELKMSLN